MAILVKRFRKVIYIDDYLERKSYTVKPLRGFTCMDFLSKRSNKINKLKNIDKEIADYKREAAENAEKLRIKLGVVKDTNGKD